MIMTIAKLPVQCIHCVVIVRAYITHKAATNNPLRLNEKHTSFHYHEEHFLAKENSSTTIFAQPDKYFVWEEKTKLQGIQQTPLWNYHKIHLHVL